jgi:putative ABC transport system permease protein
VAEAEPEILGLAQVVGKDGEPIGGSGPPTLSSNWIDNPDLNSLELAEGRAPQGNDEVVIDTATADTGELHVGDTTTVRTPAPVEVTIVGLSQMKDDASTGGVTYTSFSYEDAKRYLVAGEDKITDVVVSAEPGVTADELVARLDRVIPAGAEAISGADLAEELAQSVNEDFLDVFSTFLIVFACIALLVAAFSIFNTFTITIAQRTRESALLRALGSSRGQVLVSVLIEALLIGIVASAVGLLAGLGLAVVLKGLMDAFGFGIPTTSPVLHAGTVLWSFGIGIGVTVLASVVPAVRASRVSPLAALREVAVDRSDASVLRAVLGAIVAAGGIALVLSGAFGSGAVLLRTGLGSAALLIGVVILGPIAARPMSAVLGSPLPAVRGVTGGLARRNAMRNPRRTAGTATALLIGVAIVTGFTVFASSLKATIDDRVEATFGGDLVVAAQGFSGTGLDPELATEIGELPEVDEAAGLGFGVALVDGDQTSFTVADPAAVADMVDLDVTGGSMADMGETGVAVSTTNAEDNGWSVGSNIELTFADGQTQTVTVDAVYDEDSMLGGMIVPNAVWTPHTLQPMDTTVLVQLADDVSLDQGKAAVEDVAQAYGDPDVQTRDEFVEANAAGIDVFLYFIYALLALAILIAVMGIANTLSLSVYERTRELGLLRAVGQTRSQMRSTIRWESVIIALFGTLGGLALGSFAGWALMQAIATQEGFGVFAAPIGQLLVVVGFGALVGIVAALRPAHRAARLDVLEAIATE